MNNSFYGKTLGNVKARRSISVYRTPRTVHFQVRKILYNGFEILDENLVLVESRQRLVCLDRPIYVGAAILDTSKVFMEDFWYSGIKQQYPAAQLCFTDTDSFLFEADNFNPATLANWMDFSNSPLITPFTTNLFKDELPTQIIQEFVGLRSKLYSIKLGDGSEKKKTAGVKLCVAKRELEHEHFKEIDNCFWETNC